MSIPFAYFFSSLLVLMRASWQVMLGLTVGVVCTMAWDAVFFSGRANVRFVRPDVLLPVAALLAIVMFTACIVPAQRAARLDPLRALRAE